MTQLCLKRVRGLRLSISPVDALTGERNPSLIYYSARVYAVLSGGVGGSISCSGYFRLDGTLITRGSPSDYEQQRCELHYVINY